jgi:hypothetical protein
VLPFPGVRGRGTEGSAQGPVPTGAPVLAPAGTRTGEAAPRGPGQANDGPVVLLAHRSPTALLASPAALGAAAAMAGAVFAILRVMVAGHGDVGSFVVAGSAHVSVSPYTRGLPILPGTGYDGQFYYRMALGPLQWARSAFGITLDTLARLDRPAYPALAWLASAGQVAAVPVAMVAVNVAALGALAGLGAALARDAGRHPVWGLLPASFSGFEWTIGRDLTELTETVFVVAGLLAMRRNKPVAAALLLAVGVLARESALIVVGAVLLAQVLQLRRRSPTVAEAATWAIPALAFVAWQLALLAGTGSLPVLSSGRSNAGLPFVGLAKGLAHYVTHPGTASLLWAGELAVLTAVAASAALSLRSSTAALHERIAWAAAVALALVLVKGIWLGAVGFRSLDDVWALSCVLLISSKARLRLPAALAGAAWAVVAVQLVAFT